MRMRNQLLATDFAVWLVSTLMTAAVVFVRSVHVSPEEFRAVWTSLWIGAAVSLPVAATFSWLRNLRVTRPLRAMVETTQGMLSGKYRERFFPDTYTELDRLGEDLNRLAASLRARMQDLQDSNAKLEATLNASVSGIMIFDSEGSVSAVNRAAQDILGRSPAELRGLSFAVALTSSDLASLVYRALYRQMPGRQEVRIGRQGQKVVDATAIPLISGEDPSRPASNGAVLTFHDLTEIRRLERMRTDFVQNVSHELRTPVTVVKGFAETLRDTPPDDPDTVREMAGLIEMEASRLSTLVGGLLDLAKLESGSVAPFKAPLDPGQILRDTAKKLEPLAAQKQQVVRVVANVPPERELLADSSLMDMVLTNLLENAIKYAGEGGEIEVGVEPSEGGWLFRVTDNGPGISEEDLPRVFERFYRGSKDRSRDTGGSGLGLAVVKHCVTLHSGKVWAESAEGRGTAFYVWLP
ncbi:MAG: ATP-binding protein [Bacillota bacterium]